VMVSACATDLSRNPVDGFSAGLVDDSNLFEWNVTIIGPPDTL
jgi:ubiquitin-conjugating enzyme E2 G1